MGRKMSIPSPIHATGINTSYRLEQDAEVDMNMVLTSDLVDGYFRFGDTQLDAVESISPNSNKCLIGCFYKDTETLDSGN
jgi:hypothetical protein